MAFLDKISRVQMQSALFAGEHMRAFFCVGVVRQFGLAVVAILEITMSF